MLQPTLIGTPSSAVNFCLIGSPPAGRIGLIPVFDNRIDLAVVADRVGVLQLQASASCAGPRCAARSGSSCCRARPRPWRSPRSSGATGTFLVLSMTTHVGDAALVVDEQAFVEQLVLAADFLVLGGFDGFLAGGLPS